MKERPILFSAPMVRAILRGTKTQTRRVVKIPDWLYDEYKPVTKHCIFNEVICPCGKPGDHLWVREAFDIIEGQSPTHPVIGVDYRASHPATYPQPDDRHKAADDAINLYQWRMKDTHGMRKWKPSIHMPRWASRITLEITGVRVERLNDISVHDAIAEGCATDERDPVVDYLYLWESIHGQGSWRANPWVWVIEFKRI